MELSCIFKFLSIIKTIHWLTTSHSVHTAMDDAHNKFSDKLDEIVEAYMGFINKDKTEFNGIVNVEFEVGAFDQAHPYTYFRSAYNELRENLMQYAVSDGLKSLIDDLDNIANRTSYLLRLEHSTDWNNQ